MSDDTVSFKLYRDQQEVENEKIENGEYFTVQVFRPSQDLSIFAQRGDDPRWENVGSYTSEAEAEDKYYEMNELYVRVRVVRRESTVILGE